MNNAKHYKLKAKLLAMKYGEFLEDFSQHHDDRILVANIYEQLLEAFKIMESVADNAFICVAVNNDANRQEAIMDEIVTRFTGKSYDGHRWTEKEATA